jgi:hypothetical protein
MNKAAEIGEKIPAQPGPRDERAAANSMTPDSVIPGAGPSPRRDETPRPDAPASRPGERATVRLRDTGDEEPPRYAPEWLELREPADAGARANDLLDPLRIRLANLPGKGGIVIHDLGCGTGSMGRWLAPRLDGAQH